MKTSVKKSIFIYFLTHPIVKFVLYSRRSGLKVLHSCPTLTLVPSASHQAQTLRCADNESEVRE